MSPEAVLQALDTALRAVDHAERRGLRTRRDEPATAPLAAVRTVLAAQREQVRNGGHADVATLGALVREVAGWTPDSEIKLLAALGGAVQAARG